MGSAWRRNTKEFILVLPPHHRPFFYNYCYCYSIFMLCCLASLVTPNIAELLEASTRTAQGCSPVERDALLTFKSSVLDPSNRLASWDSYYDCCKWSGIVCRNDTTTMRVHVAELNLGNPDLDDDERMALRGDKLSPSLLSLSHLESLNLSGNDFGGAQIPEFVGSFQKLRYLDLQESNFSGTVPPQIGNLTNLRYLDLQYNWLSGTVPTQIGNLTSLRYLDLSDGGVPSDDWTFGLRVQSLDWLMHLSCLTYVEMSYVNLSDVSRNWISTVNMLPSLQVLRLSFCSLDQIPSFLSHLNLTSLLTLDLGGNYFNSAFPTWLWQLTSLSSLQLMGCFRGTIPAGIGNLHSLTELSLFNSQISGPLPHEIWSLTSLTEMLLSDCLLTGLIPPTIGNLTSLRTLDLYENSITGAVPVEIGKLKNLNYLDLSYNSLEGVVSQLHFANLTNLQYLFLSNNPLLTITIDQNWVPPFQVRTLLLNSLNLGPLFPTWLRSQNSIKILSLSNASIEDNLPEWFWISSSSTFEMIDISHNKIRGNLPLSLENLKYLNILNLGSNLFEGSIPKLPPHLWSVDLSVNSLSGYLPVNFSSSYYILSYNQIQGSIPSSICNSKQLENLDLSHNQISGKFPECGWAMAMNLRSLHLGNNNLSGEISCSIGNLSSIQSLHLNNNNLHGEIPTSLQNCSNLLLLDLGNNKLFGSIPIWIGRNLQQLTILRLRSNMFTGDIPSHIGELSNLQIIDLANNYLIGIIPHSLGNLKALISTSKTMASTASFGGGIDRIEFGEYNSITIVMKGYEYEFSKTLDLVKSIDLSNNSLVGEIPKELGFLAGLQTLNLSRNYLKGHIPNTIGGMKLLETLDLAYNTLSGAIPQGLSALNSLDHLNLSYNNLSGMIPLGYQLQTLQDASIYKGNVYLCGALINKNCSADKNSTIIDEKHEDSSQMLSDYLGITLGFLLGLWSMLVILLFKKDWRNFYFLMVDKIYNRAYVSIMIRLNKWKTSE